ncbi:MAG: ROK family protein [Chloroflexi bacterium]|nr:ROK family protein [Chloroflexota bacterium]
MTGAGEWRGPVRAARVVPPLDPGFRPMSLAREALAAEIAASGTGIRVAVAVEQPSGSAWRKDAWVFAPGHPGEAASHRAVERLCKFLLWSRGGSRLYVDGPPSLVRYLHDHYATEPTGTFDAHFMGALLFLAPFEVVGVGEAEFPPEREAGTSLGRHLDGCRIGFDLGASDRKAAAVIDGQVVFSEEIAWDPARQPDPQWHFDQVMDSLRRAAAHLPRVDAIGGSAAGAYVDNEVRAASLFRAVPPAAFEARIRGLFHDLQAAWGGIPFVIVNDGEVTALAGSMMAGTGAMLGIAMGSSQAAGYVDREGRLTSRIDELAFAPIDDNPGAPVDEWSGDRGCGVQYFSQQATARLMAAAGIAVDATTPLPERLVHLQERMAAGDPRADLVYRTVGTELGYALLLYRAHYDLEHLLLLGRVMTGAGGDVIIESARAVLAAEDRAVAEAVVFHQPDERMKRHGQAVAAASLPALR